MKRKILAILSVFILLSLLTSTAAAGSQANNVPAIPDRVFLPLLQGKGPEMSSAAAGTRWTGPDIAGEEPGEPILFQQNIPINVVFIGYENIRKNVLWSILPMNYTPVVRYPQFYGLPGRDLGLKYIYEYNIVYADTSFEDQFFTVLSKIGQPGDLTVYQEEYNAQENNVLDVNGPVLYIDAPTTEQWLEDHAADLMLDSENAYTIYFINWFGRQDFQFHVYTKTDQPDPDTGFNFGAELGSRKVIAWGGSNSRAWFHDLSAGPEAWTYNYYVDAKDLDGDGIEDYRMPPIWEYSLSGYRAPGFLTRDLAFMARFVAINLLFTTSPLYDPLVTAPGLNGLKVEHIEMLEDDPATLGTDWIDPDFIHSKLSAFEPYYDWAVNVEDNNPIGADAQRAFRIWAGLLAEDDCWNLYGDPFAELFCYFDANWPDYLPVYDPADYVGKVFAFNTLDENMGGYFGLLGYSDDNWVDGTQSHVFAFDTPTLRDYGYGFSITSVHEFGHHIGLSHPHDGYDSELNLDYGPSGPFTFAWAGDESNTIMHYMDLSADFGQFDQDNMYRYEFAGYLNWANMLLANILADPNVGDVQDLIDAAEMAADEAVAGFEAWDYLTAVTKARMSYLYLVEAADVLGLTMPVLAVPVEAAPSGDGPHFVDPVRFPDE